MIRRTLLLLLAMLTAAASAAIGGTLDIDARVAGMTAIERVHWNHRIWPAANNTRKPALDAVLPESVIRQHAQDVIERSVELEQRWGVRISSAMLQAEVERMARETRNASMLRELFDALDNDPQLIAECLARAILVDHLWTSVREHLSEMPASDGALIDVSTFVSESAGLGRVPDLPQSGSCTPDTWSGPLQKVASRRKSHSAVWTGTEMIVWGAVYPAAVGGARYNPSSDSWRAIPHTNAPMTYGGQTLLWTDSRIVVWGGYADTGRETNARGDLRSFR